MWLLGLDTATPLTTVALAAVDASRGTCELVAERGYDDPRRHGEVITLLIDEVVDAAGLTVSDLDAIGVGVGPGAFTGLRVGIATAQALAFGLNKPCFGVCTLDAIAHRTLEAEPFAVITDARRREYFWRSYRQHLTPADAPAVGDAAAVTEAVGELRCFIMAGTPPPADVACQETGPPSAGALCEVVAFRLANQQPLEPVGPIYLRSPDVSAPSPTKSVLA